MELNASQKFCAATALAKHQGWLKAVLLARLRSREAVDEVMQEIAIAAVNQQAKAEPIQQTGPWLYRIALTQVLLYRRKNGRRRRFLQNFTQAVPLNEPATADHNPLQWLLLQERQQSVRETMERLGDREREILLLKYSEGLTYEQIADRLGLTSSSVRMRLHRARTKLRMQLASSISNADTTELTEHPIV